MKTIYTIIIAAFFVSCGNSSNTETTNTSDTDTTSQQEVVVSEEPEEVKKPNLLLGTWTINDTKLGLKQTVTYKEDGTYNMEMGVTQRSGIWELKDSILISKNEPDSPGQETTITKLDEEHLWIIWKPKSGRARELKYSRK